MGKPSSRQPAEAPGDYEVGYGKPPKHTRFKPGQSGNPKGRPKGQRNFSTVFDEALNEKISLREGEQTRRVSKLDGLVRVTINNALKGDPKAFASFVQLARMRGFAAEEPIAPIQESWSCWVGFSRN